MHVLDIGGIVVSRRDAVCVPDLDGVVVSSRRCVCTRFRRRCSLLCIVSVRLAGCFVDSAGGGGWCTGVCGWGVGAGGGGGGVSVHLLMSGFQMLLM